MGSKISTATQVDAETSPIGDGQFVLERVLLNALFQQGLVQGGYAKLQLVRADGEKIWAFFSGP